MRFNANNRSEEVRLGEGGCRGQIGGRPANHCAARRQGNAFTLLELLVVMAIIGILATIGIPALSGIGGNLDVDAAHRQLLDDLSYARLKAINERTRVYVAFVPPSIVDANWSGLDAEERKELEKLLEYQYRGYALFTERSLGDQPGRPNPQFITEWRTLPDGIFISPFEFQRSGSETLRLSQDLTNRPFAYFPVRFPLETSEKPNAQLHANDILKYLPCIVFDYQGRLVSPDGRTGSDEYITLTKGSIIYAMDANKKLTFSPAEVIETPKSNHVYNPAIRVDWLTGRARTILPGGGKG